ncbi:MAG: HesA/MoeB/ThiF family protein, partial [Bacillota bacterium]|nr:HesA/MoeB/ThiF family protein [Bacillota bacterium]
MEREEALRFSRQILLPQVGLVGQEKIQRGKVLIVGVGALGSAAALYLAAAGVGTLGLVDGDRVDIHNLHRQVLFGEEDVGRLKVEAAQKRLRFLREKLKVEIYPFFLTEQNAAELLDPYDVIVSGADDFTPRYAISDAAVRLKKPWIDASILGFYGQATAFWPGEGCYRCLHPEPPPLEVAGSCSQAGVMGPLAGHMGTLQAMEALKVLLGEKPSLTGTLLTVDMEDLQHRSFRWQRNPSCPACNGP